VPRPPKLKVYCTPVGFHNAVVAVPSQKAALAAWGTTTNLFADGYASVVEDPDLQAEALAHPGQVIKKPRGDVAAMLGPEPARSMAGQRDRKPPSKPRPVADRSKLDVAERALAQAEREVSKELADLAIERVAIERREAEIRAKSEARLDALRRARDQAEAAYVKAGGRA
jgi:Xaa-Pro aminopeptidase